MTVIAFDGEFLVADGRATTDGGTTLVYDSFRKLHNLTIPKLGKCVVAFCGALDMLGPYLESLKANGLAPLDEDLGGGDEMYMRSLIVTNKGVCYEHSTDGGWHIVQGPVATGSGRTIAQHYLTCGFSALEAVKQTVKTELSCGGQIMICDVKKGLIEVYSPV